MPKKVAPHQVKKEIVEAQPRHFLYTPSSSSIFKKNLFTLINHKKYRRPPGKVIVALATWCAFCRVLGGGDL
jgi:hypothetical protein